MANPVFYQKDYRNIFDYLYDFGSCPFSEIPFTDADNLVLSGLAYIPFQEFEGTNNNFVSKTISELCIDFLAWLKVSYFAVEFPEWMKKSIFLATALLKCPRFSKATVTDFGYYFCDVNGAPAQFGALSIDLPDHTFAIAFRGTDSSLAGWKEDFNLALKDSTPGQEMAARFTEVEIEKHHGNKYFRLMGHSKGGNFAVYAASMLTLSQSKHLLNVYSDDGPGLSRNFFDSKGHMQIKNKIVHIVPYECVIGNLLNREEITYVVESDEKTDFIMQHDLYTWKMDGIGFKKLKSVSPMSIFIRNSLNELVTVKLQDMKERESFINAFIDTMDKTGVTNVDHIFADPSSFIRLFLKTTKTDKDGRKVLIKGLKDTISCFTNHWGEYQANIKASKANADLARSYTEIEEY
jgi:hypothetical protein